MQSCESTYWITLLGGLLSLAMRVGGLGCRRSGRFCVNRHSCIILQCARSRSAGAKLSGRRRHCGEGFLSGGLLQGEVFDVVA